MAAGRWTTIFLKYGKESIIKQSKFVDTIHYLKKEAISNLETELEKCRLYDHKNFIDDYNKKSIGHIAFVWFYKGIPKCYGFAFKFISDSTEKVKIRIDDYKFNLNQPNVPNIVPMGTVSAIQHIYNNLNFWLNNKPYERGMNRLLQVQSDSASATVGPPFSILRITKKGLKWYTHGACK